MKYALVLLMTLTACAHDNSPRNMAGKKACEFEPGDRVEFYNAQNYFTNSGNYTVKIVALYPDCLIVIQSDNTLRSDMTVGQSYVRKLP